MRCLSISAFVLALAVVVAVVVYVVAHPVPIVLMFHSVVSPAGGQDVSPESLVTLVGAVQRQESPVLFTTDSSDRSIYDHFVPTVHKHRLPIVVFLLPAGIGRAGMLTWDQVRDLERDGVIVGSHTLTHAWLPDLTEEELRCEVCGSKEWIEAELGHPIHLLAYPYGAFDTRVVTIAQDCGYTRAYSTAPGRRVADDDPFAAKRVAVNELTVSNTWLRHLALSGYWTSARETVLWFLPITIPRKPTDWSYEDWRRSRPSFSEMRSCRRLAGKSF